MYINIWEKRKPIFRIILLDFCWNSVNFPTTKKINFHPFNQFLSISFNLNSKQGKPYKFSEIFLIVVFVAVWVGGIPMECLMNGCQHLSWIFPSLFFFAFSCSFLVQTSPCSSTFHMVLYGFTFSLKLILVWYGWVQKKIRTPVQSSDPLQNAARWKLQVSALSTGEILDSTH